jgi:hypothetical protein
VYNKKSNDSNNFENDICNNDTFNNSWNNISNYSPESNNCIQSNTNSPHKNNKEMIQNLEMKKTGSPNR